MLHLNIIKVKTPEEMGKAAADEFEAVICRKPACVMGLATGSTPLPLYRELIAREQAGKLDFSRVRSANLDEYKGLAPDHPQSYRRFMQENLFDHISIKPRKHHRSRWPGRGHPRHVRSLRAPDRGLGRRGHPAAWHRP